MNWYARNCRWFLPTMTYILGVISSCIIGYFAFMSRLDTIEFKVDLLHENYNTEKKNIYDVFHEHHVKIANIDTLIQKKIGEENVLDF